MFLQSMSSHDIIFILFENENIYVKEKCSFFDHWF